MKFGMPWNGPEVAAVAEQAGCAAFCTGDFADHDAYLQLAEMAKGTRRAEVGTAIAYAFARTPYAHAMAARAVHHAAPGRMFLGFGSGARRINRDWFGVPADRPIARIKELLGAVRAYLDAENGDTVRFSGEFYDIRADIRAPVLGRVDMPLLLAGFNAGMAAAAGEVADGVIGHGLFTTLWWDEVVRPAVASGRARSPGGRPEWLETGWLITAIDDDDPERARLDARRMIAFYLTVRTYDPFIAHHGWTSEVQRIRTAFAARDTDAMALAVTDDMLSAIALAGTGEEARRQLAARGAGLPADIVFAAPPSYLVSKRRQRDYARASLALIGTGIGGLSSTLPEKRNS
ncbi:LLM class flavin-dependent oxidoreductase [Streptomyces gardneri]|nr:LLM class flavin-dependent oxidoreductase [Streptomyces gardneri]